MHYYTHMSVPDAGSLENLHPAASAHAQATIAFLSDTMTPLAADGDGAPRAAQHAQHAPPSTAHSSGSSTDTACAAQPLGPQSPTAGISDSAAPRVRCGCGDTVEAAAAVASVFAGVVGRYEALLPRDSLRRILLQLQTLIVSMTQMRNRPGQLRQAQQPHAVRSVQGGPQRAMLEGGRAGAHGCEDPEPRCEHCSAECEDSGGGAGGGVSGGRAGEGTGGPHTGVCAACGRSLRQAGGEAEGAAAEEGGRESGPRVAAAIQGTTEALLATLAGKLAQLKVVRCCRACQACLPSLHACDGEDLRRVPGVAERVVYLTA